MSSADSSSTPSRAALILPGGGARGAYQVGVLKGIAEMVPDHCNPFPIVCGVSAGAINTAVLASHAHEFKHGIERLTAFWSRLRVESIYKADFFTVAKTGLNWLLALTFGGLGIANPRSLLDNRPLERLLAEELDFDGIETAIERGALHGVAVTASGYACARAATFFQGADSLEPWERARREGIRAKLTVDHLLASASLPFVFAARRIGREYFGDGSLRLTAPLSPAIRLGADRIMVIGVRDERRDELPDEPIEYPSLGDIGGYVLDTLFMDNLNEDIARLRRVNRTLDLLTPGQAAESGLRHVDALVLRPSSDVREIARTHAERMPWTIRMLLRGVGGWGNGWRLPSYLLFEPPFCDALISLGYEDALARREEIQRFLDVDCRADASG